MSLRRCLAVLALLLLGPAFAAGDVPSTMLDGLSWRLVGPFRGGWGTVAEGIPDQPDTFYFAAAGGGVWKTVNAGRTWVPLGDRLPAASVGALAIAPTDPRTIYAGTGQVTTRYDIAAGQGVFRSRDGGTSWEPAGLAATRHIGRLWVDPRSADTVLAAAFGHAYGPNAERGVYRTSDGGRTWQRTLFVSENTGAVDLAADPANPDIVFASVWQMRFQPWLNYFTPDVGAESGIYRSTDAGRTWQHLGEGLPRGPLGRIGLAAAHVGTTTRVYAVIDAEHDGGLYRSDDAGAHWQQVNADGELANGYFAQLTVVPGDIDTVYAMGRSIRRCTQGGAQCTIVKGAPGGDDYHHLWINPAHPDHMITSADQGVVVSVDGGTTWSSWYNQPTGQFYHLAADRRFPYRIYSGQQDSGSVGILSRSDYGAITYRDWNSVGADERDYDIPDPQDPDIVYGSGLGGRLSRWDARTGEVQNIAPWPIMSYGKRPTDYRYRYTWITPIAVAQKPPYPLYLGAQVLFRSTDRGAHWEPISPDLSAKTKSGKGCEGRLDRRAARDCGYGVIHSIGLSPRDNQEIWSGTDDGLVQMTRDGGEHWRNVTPPDLPAWAKVTSVEVSPLVPGTAYLAVDNHAQDDFRPFAYRTTDWGGHWTRIDAGLPKDGFLSVLRADTVRAGLLFAGSDSGVSVSFDDGAHWQSLQRNLPTAWVRDLLVHENDLIAATQGRAIWVLDDLAPLRQLDAGLASAHLFTPAPAVRVRRNQNRDTPLPPEEPAGRNPPAGAVIDYWLGQDARRVVVEIRDAQDRLVRRYASDEAAGLLPIERYFAESWLRPAPPPATHAGAHRLVWDLREARPAASGYEYSIAAIAGEDTPVVPEGVLMPPGDYRVALDVDGTLLRQPLVVRADPRTGVDTAVLATTIAFAHEVQAALARDYAATLEIGWLRRRLAELGKRHTPQNGGKAIATAIARLEGRLQPLHTGTGDASLNLEAIGGVLGSLEVDIEASDALPTASQREVYAASVVRLDHALDLWTKIRADDVATLDAALRGNGDEGLTIPPAESLREAASVESKELP